MSKDEIQRILKMVAEGKVSPEEGENLLNALDSGPHQVRCPYCAESIPSGSPVCPICHTQLAAEARPANPAEGFRGLSKLNLFLVIYSLIVGGVILSSQLGGWALSVQSLLAVVGILSGVFMIKGRAAGWTLGIGWSAIQIIPFMLNGAVLNKQFFHIGITTQTNGTGIGFNAVGLILLLLFMKGRNQAGFGTTHDPHGGSY